MSRPPDQLRSRRRAVVLAHHPDVGGDPDELIAQLRLLDRPAAAHGCVVFVRQPRGLARLTGWFRARRAARNRAPRVH